MSSFTLGDQTFEFGPFTLKDVQRLAPLLKQADGRTPTGLALAEMTTLAQTQASTTILWIAAQTHRPELTYEDFLGIKGVKVTDIPSAQLAVGRVIGYYADPQAEAPPTGEAVGEALPSPS